MVLGAVWGRTRKIAKREKGESIGWQSIYKLGFFYCFNIGGSGSLSPKIN
jgi:hypothetical protein